MNDCKLNKACPKDPCGCAEPVFSVEAMPDDPTILRFNVNGKSVWYDFSPVVSSAEARTALNVNSVGRTLNYLGEKTENTITANELGSIIHMADLGDIDENTITDNGILNYRVSSDCPAGCEGTANKWVSTNPIEAGTQSLSYILGSDADGKMFSLMPPSSANTFSYLSWAAENKAEWVKPRPIVAVTSNYAPLYLDKTTGEIVVLNGGS